MHQRIEKSGFRAGEYVGYCDGVWHIKKRSDLNLWEARKADGRDLFRGRTLDSIGDGLDQRANVATAHAFQGKLK